MALLALAPRAEADAPTTFRVRFEVARVDERPVVSEAWIREQLANANTIFAPAGVAFVHAETTALEGRAELVTRAHRHQLNPRVRGEVINVFVVASLADVDVPGRFIRGVHWRSRRGTERTQHYCTLSRIAGPTVLAHEFGHFFGNPHSPTPGNIMSYERGEGPPFFDAAQIRRIRRLMARFVASGELRAEPG